MENGQTVGGAVTIANAVYPKDTAWFSAQDNFADNGYLEIIGSLLHDEKLQYDADTIMNSKDVRFNYLVYEAQMFDNIAANAVGLMFVDSTTEVGKMYQYSLSATNGNYATSITMDTTVGRWNNFEYDFNFRFPTNSSLTYMTERFGNEPTDFIPLMLKPYGDSVVLRWGTNHPELHYKTLEMGYKILRTDENGNRDTIAFVKPYAREQMSAELVKNDSMALVAAQLLYGNKDYTPQDATQFDADYRNNYSFSLYAADRSALAANILGLRYVDKDVEVGKFYTYKLYTEATDFPFATSAETVENLPVLNNQPKSFVVEAGDKVIVLKWDKYENQRNFSAYILERSDDGGQTFESLTAAPLIFLEDERIPTEEFSYKDSVYVNDVEFTYRLQGIDAFADLSYYAELKAMAKDLTPPDEAQLDTVFFNAVGRNIEINWFALPYAPEDFAGYQVMMGNTMDGAFQNISGILPPTATFYEYKNDTTFDGQTAHYFKIATLDKSGNRAESVARYAHIPDLKAPEAPTELEGFIDENGIVTLAWTHSPDKDVAGYFVYFANSPNDEFSPMNKRPINANIFYDTIPVNSLNEKIYYAVAAEDLLDNRGKVSEMIALSRPDVVPPLRPIMNAVEANNEGVEVSWNASPSTDVVRYEVNRRNRGATEWAMLDTVSAFAELSFTDDNMIVGKIYEYAVRAIDDADLYSDYAFPRQGQQNFGGTAVMIQNLNLQFDESQNKISLTWEFQPPMQVPENSQDYYFYIYKSYGGEVIKELSRTDSNVFTFTDDEIETGVLHNYAIQVVFDTGHSGKVSEVQSIEIP